MSRLWRWAWPGYLFALPVTVIGFVIATVFYRARDWQWCDGVLTCVAGRLENGVTRIWGRPNAQTLGWLQIYDTAEYRNYPDLRVHENVHVVQVFAGGLVGAVLGALVGVLASWSVLLWSGIGGLTGALMFSLVYGAFFLFFWAKQGFGDWYFAYRANPFEVQAYARQDKFIANAGNASVSDAEKTRPWGA